MEVILSTSPQTEQHGVVEVQEGLRRAAKVGWSQWQWWQVHCEKVVGARICSWRAGHSSRGGACFALHVAARYKPCQRALPGSRPGAPLSR